MSTTPYNLPAKLRYTPFVKSLSKLSRSIQSFGKATGIKALAQFPPFNDRGPRPVFFALADDGLAPTRLLWDLKTIYMAGTAQRLVDKYAISREEADRFALRSQELALHAIQAGRFDIEIEPIQLPDGSFFTRDEHPRKTSFAALQALKPVLRTRDITAGNSSGINDGACALLLASTAKVEELHAIPIAELVDIYSVGVDPEEMGIGPVEAINGLLKRNNLTLDQIDLIELNEAFAAQYLAVEKQLHLDRSKVNVNGGAIALGHPLGMSGARLPLTLVHEMKRRELKHGVAALCVGGGHGIAGLFRRP